MFLSSISILSLVASILCQVQYGQQWRPNWGNPTHTQRCSITPLAESVDNFGSSLTEAIGELSNIFMSPFSIFNALAMTFVGAEGQTAEQMEDALQLKDNGFDKQKLNEAFQNYIDMVEVGNDDYSLLIANGIFLQVDYKLHFSYINDIHFYYHGSLKEVDFQKHANEAKDDINQFVAEKTGNMIEKLFEEPLGQDTVMVLINAIYFKGTWKTQFPKDKTSDGDFYTSGGSIKSVKFMKLEKTTFRYFEDLYSGYQFLELPYNGEDISMIIALPRDSTRVPALDITTDRLCSINRSLSNTEISYIAIPKFHLEYERELAGDLQQLGIKDLFTNSANLSGIIQSKKIKVSNVLHKAIIDVNEEGTEAAAVTGVVVVTLSLNSNPITFIADHPFSFYIADNRNGLVLFSGRVSDF